MTYVRNKQMAFVLEMSEADFRNVIREQTASFASIKLSKIQWTVITINSSKSEIHMILTSKLQQYFKTWNEFAQNAFQMTLNEDERVQTMEEVRQLLKWSKKVHVSTSFY